LLAVDRVSFAVHQGQIFGFLDPMGLVPEESNVYTELSARDNRYSSPGFTVCREANVMHSSSIAGPDMAAPALVSAIHDASGVWIRELPATPERVLKALPG
jgi:hypothetical protein